MNKSYIITLNIDIKGGKIAKNKLVNHL